MPSGCPFSGAGAERPTGDVSRRGFLSMAAAAAAVPTIVGATGVAGAGTASANEIVAAAPAAELVPHAKKMRGAEIAVKVSRTSKARYGLMFPQLPAFKPSDGLLVWLAGVMNDGKAPLSDVRDSDVAFDNPAIPAGYIYFGQFIDHDMTLDKTPLSLQRQDPLATTNFDTPKFDLGSVYGKGMKGSPELYDANRPGYMAVNDHDDLHDLPRDSVGAAYLGDPRNDENVIVAQFHAVFLRLHNKFMDQGMTFAMARRQCQWHYQWLIVNDYLPRIVGKEVVDSIIKRVGTGPITYAGKFYKAVPVDKPYMPIEYSGAAYRFGHSMIRAEYEVQDAHTVPIFAPEGYADLRGSRQIPSDLWIDWNYFFEIPGMNSPDDRNISRLIDSQISLPLYNLPPTIVARTEKAIIALAERNLLRGKRLGLPAGQDVAKAMGVTPLTNAQLGLKQTGWNGKAPLWYYVLKEAEILNRGTKLGPVGGRIVAEVILGIMAADSQSYFNLKPGFQWRQTKGMGDLLLLADAIDPRARLAPIEDVEIPGGEFEMEELEEGEEINPAATAPVESADLLPV